MLAQLSDLFSRQTWLLICIVCYGAPLLGMAAGLAIWRRKGLAWKSAVAFPYYFLVGIVILTHWESASMALVFVGTLLAGPALCLLLFLPIGRVD